MRDLITIQADINSTENRKNEVGATQTDIDQWNAQIAEFKKEKEAAQQSEKDHADRVETSKTEFAYFLDKLTSNGLTMRQMCGTDSQYNLLRMSVEDGVTEIVESYSKKITDLETVHKAELQIASDREAYLQQENGTLQVNLESTTRQVLEKIVERDEFSQKCKQAEIDKQDAESKRNAAVNAMEEMKAELDKLRNPQPLIGTEEQEKLKQAAADKVKAERTIFNVLPVEAINPKNFTATIVATGEQITFNWTTTNSWIILTDPNEIEQFRQSQAVLPSVPLDNSQVTAVPPELPTAVGTDFRPQDVPSTNATGNPSLEGNQSVSESVGQTESQVAPSPVTRAEHEALKARVEVIEKHANIQAVA